MSNDVRLKTGLAPDTVWGHFGHVRSTTTGNGPVLGLLELPVVGGLDGGAWMVYVRGPMVCVACPPSPPALTVLAMAALEPAGSPLVWEVMSSATIGRKGSPARAGMIRDHLLRPFSRSCWSFTGRPSRSVAVA